MKGRVSVCCDGGRGAWARQGTASPLWAHDRGLDGVGARGSDAGETTITAEVATTTRPRHARGSGATRAGNHDDNYDGGDDNYANEICGDDVEECEEGPGCDRQK
jgi:hypothetical protein